MRVAQAPHRLPLLGNALPLALRRTAYLQTLREVGEVVEVAVGRRRLYVLNSPQAIHEVLVTQGEHFDKGPMFDNLGPFLGNGVLTCPRSEHRSQRRTLQPAFQRQAVARYAPAIARKAAEQTAGYQEGQILDMRAELRRITVLVMGGIMIAADGTEDVAQQMHRSLPLLIRGVMRRTLMPAEFLNRIPTPATRRYDRAAADLRAAVGRTLDDYRRGDGAHDDVLSGLLAARDEDGRPLADELIIDQIVTLLLTGSDSTTATMSWFLHALSRNPAAEAAIRDELDRTLGGRLPTVADLPDLPRLTDALHESLRLHHPVWFLTRRSVAPVRIAGTDHPAGTEFAYSLATLHRDPGLFPDPLAFRPERWSAQELPQRNAWIPFGAGTRKCIGDDLAMTEMLLILAVILKDWSLRPAEDRPVRPVPLAVIHPDRLMLRLQRPSRRTLPTPPAPEEPVRGTASGPGGASRSG
ncbi:cytochrome P450 [Streptomyces sp. NPDC048297]|uniref:cytochrome P450 n=1 Tax=Streptomyces sp. NPDC048297 TaxID=3365531 RepID=UPI0037161E6F